MCGIAAYFAYGRGDERLSREAFLRVRDAMRLRGPDAEGFWGTGDGRVMLGHRRLAIIDLKAQSNQPMQLADAGLQITFNGEIFNYRELRTELAAQGCIFTTASDTEVILHAYARWGLQALDRLRGMFAFALWDGRARSLLLARDPLGIKPLFAYDNGASVLAASQVRAIRASPAGLSSDPIGHMGFFVNGYVPEPYTMFREVRAIPAGGYRIYRDGKATDGRYFSLPAIAAAASTQRIAPAERAELIRDSLTRSIASHLVADVDVGLFLSGGVDSTLLGLVAGRTGDSSLMSLTVGAEEFKGTARDEVQLASQFAELIGLPHRFEYHGEPDFTALMGDILSSMDQPSTDGVNTFMVSHMARQQGFKVALSGLGGDEIFAGYPSFSQVPRLVDQVGRLGPVQHAGKLVRVLGQRVIGTLTSPKYASLLEFGGTYSGAYLLRRALFLPWELRTADGDDFSEDVCLAAAQHGVAETELESVRSPSGRVALLEMTRYMKNQLLRDSDWAGMGCSLEIRVPFVDSQLVRELAPLVFGDDPLSKHEASAALYHPMQKEIVERPKQGFGLPVRDWMAARFGVSRRGLRDWAHFVYRQWCRSVGTEPLILTDVKQPPAFARPVAQSA